MAVKASPTSGKYFDHIVTILMENNDLPSVLSQGPYEAKLASNYTLARGYSGVSHPSQPNYAVLISGQIGVNSNDGICCGQDSHMNLVDSLESQGLTWEAFAENQTTGDCMGSHIDTDHFPFLYFADIVRSPPRCNMLVGTTAPKDAEFITVLNSNAGWPNFIWLTPNTSDDAHNTSIPYGDNYLSVLVPKILGSTLFKTQRSALFIVYDEGNDVACSNGVGSDCVYASWSGPVAKKGFASDNHYNHYSYLHTIEDNWALTSLTQQDAAAPVMSEFLMGNTSNNPFQWTAIVIIVIAAGALALVISRKILPSVKKARVSGGT